ncbi:MAG: aminopeptidase [Desulfobacterales bacterium]|jgi:aminopeptidase|nr:aminopeptidase [Desulfobacterales bacterium]
MLTERQLENYAEVLWWALTTARRNRFRKQEIVQVRFHAGAIRLAELLYRNLLREGLNPVLRIAGTPEMERQFYRLAGPSQLAFIPPGEERLMQRLNGGIFLHAPDSLTHLKETDPRKIARTAVSQKPLRAILERREARGEYGWTLCMLPTAELARRAGTTLRSYTREVVKACFLDSPSPVARWVEIHRRASEIKNWLDRMKVKAFHIESAGVDLQLVLGERRRWAGISGRNIPSFELFVSPDGRGTRGRFFADQPSFRSGNIVRGVRLEFDRGRVVRATAEEGEEFLRRQLAMDAGARRVGEFSLTDKRFSRISRFMANTLYDENYGGPFGNSHIALGSSYAVTYAGPTHRLTAALREKLGFNDSALHWDLVNTEKKRVSALLADGSRQVVYEDGLFKN